MKYFRRIAVLLLFVAVPAAIYMFYWNSAVRSVQIVFTSDGHGHVYPSTAYWKKGSPEIGGLGALSTFLKETDKPYILADSGDFFQGTPEGILSRGRLLIDIMNMIGYDVLAPGNHEFDLGTGALKDLAGKAQFPFVCSNIEEEATGTVPGYLKNRFILPYGDLEIGFTGVLTDRMKYLTLEKNIEGLSFLDPVEAVNKTAAALREEGADLVIVLSHMGLKNDKEIASDIKQADVVLGGHSHIALQKPVRFGRLLICQPGSNFLYAGKLVLYYCPGEQRTLAYSYRLEPLYISEYSPDEEVDALVDKFLDTVDVKLNRVIGKSERFLSPYPEGELKKNGETALGDWQTDIMREETESDFAFQNSGGIRGPLPSGDIKIRDVWELSPFGNTLVKMTLSGKQIYRLMEQSVDENGANMQISGLSMVYNSSLPDGLRVLNLIVEDEEEGKHELDPEKDYTVVTNSFLAAGGDGYTVFGEAEDIKDTGIVLRDLEIEYIKEHSPFSPKIEKRLINVSLDNRYF